MSTVLDLRPNGNSLKRRRPQNRAHRRRRNTYPKGLSEPRITIESTTRAAPRKHSNHSRVSVTKGSRGFGGANFRSFLSQTRFFGLPRQIPAYAISLTLLAILAASGIGWLAQEVLQSLLIFRT